MEKNKKKRGNNINRVFWHKNLGQNRFRKRMNVSSAIAIHNTCFGFCGGGVCGLTLNS
jgi:hypothetical protein